MKLKKKQRKLLTCALGIVCAAGVVLMVRQSIQYRRAAELNEQAQALLQMQAAEQAPTVTLPEDLPTELEELYLTQAPLDESAAFLLTADYSALQDFNPDVFGWVFVPGCDISFPLLRSRDNQDYLYTAWDKTFSLAGSVFLECKNNRDMMDFHSIIYGHNMKNGTMFAPLKQYENADFWPEHPYVYVLADGILRRYEVFSAYEAKVKSETYRLYFEDEAMKQTAIDLFRSSSLVANGTDVTTDDYIMTLSTCTGRGTYEARFVIHTVLTGVWCQ